MNQPPALAQNDAQIAERSVVELHEWIAAVFNGAADHSAALEKLRASFNPSFRMVTPQGALLDQTQVLALFENNVGQRAGLEIEIDACETLLSGPAGVVCRYRETHRRAGELLGRRWSTALIEVTANGWPVWRELQETLIA